MENQYPGLSSVTVNNEKGSYEAAKHMLSRGKKRFIIISGTTGHDDNDVIKAREDGFKKGLAESGMTLAEEVKEKVIEYTFQEGIECFDRIIERVKDVDAIFCASGDMVAMGAMRRAKELGYKIPGDIAFCGFDDVSAAQVVSPALTTVRQPIRKMGEEAFRLALEFVEGTRKDPAEIILPTELIIREST